MNNPHIEELKKKYMVRGSIEPPPKHKGNLQAQINRIKAIENFIKDKNIDKLELNRLECSVHALSKLIKLKNG